MPVQQKGLLCQWVQPLVLQDQDDVELLNTAVGATRVPMIGRTLGRYRIVERIGEGGMGEVFLAEDLKLKRRIALKLVRPEHRQSEEARRRLIQEAQTVADLNHPHICTVHDIGEAEGETYIAMEFVEGRPLKDSIAAGRVPVETTIRYGIQIAEALSHAHARGVVHRDLKSSNVLVLPSGDVKVLDFGLAAHRPPDEERDPTSVATVGPDEVVGGTLPYMAPEVLCGAPGDRRADIWALGVLLYELVCARFPFRGTSSELRSSILRESPSPFPAAVPMALRGIILKCLQKDPTRRYHDASEVGAALETSLAAGPSRLFISSSRYLRPRQLIGAAIVLVAVAATGVVWKVVWPREPLATKPTRLLIGDFENTTGDPIYDQTVREALAISLEQSRHFSVVPRSRIYEVLKRMKRLGVVKIDEKIGSEICARENVPVFLSGGIQMSGERVQIALRAVDAHNGNVRLVESVSFERKEELFEQVNALGRRVLKGLGEGISGGWSGPQPFEKVTTQSLRALQLYSKGKDHLLAGELITAIRLLEGATNIDPDFAMGYLWLGKAHEARGEATLSFENFAKAYSLRAPLTEGERLHIEGAYFGSRQMYEQQVERFQVLAGLFPDDVEVRILLASAHSALEDLEPAIAELREVLRLDPKNARARGSMILDLAQVGRYEEAIGVHREAVKRGLHSPHFLWGLGLAYFGKGSLEKARESFTRLESAGGGFPPFGSVNLARIAIYQGRLEEANGLLRTGLLQDQVSNLAGWEIVRRHMLARIHWFRGQGNMARSELEKILESGELSDRDYLESGTLFASMGEAEAARGTLDRLRDSGEGRSGRHYQQCLHQLEGEILLAEHRFEAARISFARAAALQPSFMSHLGRARANYALGDREAAISELKEVLRQRSEVLVSLFPAIWPLVHLELAELYRNGGNPNAADRHCEAFRDIWQRADLMSVIDARNCKWEGRVDWLSRPILGAQSGS